MEYISGPKVAATPKNCIHFRKGSVFLYLLKFDKIYLRHNTLTTMLCNYHTCCNMLGLLCTKK